MPFLLIINIPYFYFLNLFLHWKQLDVHSMLVGSSHTFLDSHACYEVEASDYKHNLLSLLLEDSTRYIYRLFVHSSFLIMLSLDGHWLFI